LRFGILTISDRSARGEREDLSGPALAARVEQEGWEASRTAVIPDEEGEIEAMLTEWADSGDLDLVLTTGGTGFTSRDVTPEVTKAVIDRRAPGMEEAMRAASMLITPMAMLSRAAAGIRGKVLIVNLPGSPKGAVENLEAILPVLEHAVGQLNDTGSQNHETG